MGVTINRSLSKETINHRNALEVMLRSAPDCMLCTDSIDTVMHNKKYGYVLTFPDCTVLYACKTSKLEDISIFFQRDWTKSGYLHAPYRMSIEMENGGIHHYWIRSVGQLKRALKSWELNHRSF